MKRLLFIIFLLFLSGCKTQEITEPVLLKDDLNSINDVFLLALTNIEETITFDYNSFELFVINRENTFYISQLQVTYFIPETNQKGVLTCTEESERLSCNKAILVPVDKPFKYEITLPDFISFLEDINLDEIKETNESFWNTDIFNHDYHLRIRMRDIPSEQINFDTSPIHYGVYKNGEYYVRGSLIFNGYFLEISFEDLKQTEKINVYYYSSIN